MFIFLFWYCFILGLRSHIYHDSIQIENWVHQRYRDRFLQSKFYYLTNFLLEFLIQEHIIQIITLIVFFFQLLVVFIYFKSYFCLFWPLDFFLPVLCYLLYSYEIRKYLSIESIMWFTYPLIDFISRYHNSPISLIKNK